MPKVALPSTQINFWDHFIQILLPYNYCKVVSDLPKYHQKELFWSYFVFRSILHWNPHCTLKKVATWLKMVRFLKQKQFPNWVSVLITLAPCMYLFVDRVKNKNHPTTVCSLACRWRLRSADRESFSIDNLRGQQLKARLYSSVVLQNSWGKKEKKKSVAKRLGG